MSQQHANDALDRKDNNGDYCPENCRWATRSVQSRNTRRARTITFNGQTKHICDWAEALGINADRLRARKEAGLTPEQIFDPAIRKPGPSRR